MGVSKRLSPSPPKTSELDSSEAHYIQFSTVALIRPFPRRWHVDCPIACCIYVPVQEEAPGARKFKEGLYERQTLPAEFSRTCFRVYAESSGPCRCSERLERESVGNHYRRKTAPARGRPQHSHGSRRRLRRREFDSKALYAL